MKFQIDNMYKNILKDKNNAFLVTEVLEQTKNGVHLEVQWYQLTDSGKYITIGVDGDFYIPKNQILHYVLV